MDHVDCIVIGAGILGLAVARTLALRGHEVIVLEQENAIGTGVSSRNSEVIHAGIYYAPGSLKATLCVRGKHLLYEYCAQRNIAHRRCGKLIVRTRPEEDAKLHTLMQRASANGVTDLQFLSPDEARTLESQLRCTSALLSPSSGIVDSHGLMLSLLGDAQNAGALLALKSGFDRAYLQGDLWRVQTGGEAPFELTANWLINCAGLNAQTVAQRMEGFDPAHIPTPHWAKGHYFSLSGRAPFSRLIYPVPADGGLGVHLTLDLGGQAKFGPDVEWLQTASDAASLDYTVDPQRAASFYREVRHYWPALPDDALQPAYSGVRPKLSGPGEDAADFCILGPSEHGAPGVLQLFGIESPGLTSALALAELVATRISEQ
ncbi:MAG: NAD(P)/FAD-dependent oxidoreductase [Burkholderiaceae bacterium]